MYFLFAGNKKSKHNLLINIYVHIFFNLKHFYFVVISEIFATTNTMYSSLPNKRTSRISVQGGILTKNK